jgi:hypothetical protein
VKKGYRDYKRELENIIREILESDLSRENKEDLLKFHENNIAMGLKTSTLHSQLHNLYGTTYYRQMAVLVDTEFRELYRLVDLLGYRLSETPLGYYRMNFHYYPTLFRFLSKFRLQYNRHNGDGQPISTPLNST